MSFLTTRNNATQSVVPIEEDKIILIEVKRVSESDSYLKVDFETILTGITATTNLYKSNTPSSTINKFIDAINPDAENLKDLIGAQVAVVFSIKEHLKNTYYNIIHVFPMEAALVEHLDDFEQSTDSVEEVVFEDEFEEEEIQYPRQSKIHPSVHSQNSPLEKRSPSKLGSKTGERKAVMGPRANHSPVRSNVAKMLEEDDE